MKRLFCAIPLVCLLCFAFGCQDKAAMAELEAFKAQAEIEEQNIKNVYLWEKMWNEGNLDIVEQIMGHVKLSSQFESHRNPLQLTA